MIGRALARVVMVPLGLLIAAAVAMFVIGSLGLERLTQELHRTGDGGGILGTVFGAAWGIFKNWGTVSRMLSALTITPVLLLVIAGEVARLRSAMYYVLGGGLALGLIPLLARVEAGGALQLPAATIWQVFATGGFAAGFVYWLIAGRSA
jgi:hypothetical protein